jgi:uncharacterized membrane protein
VIGVAMIILGLLVYLPVGVIFNLGLLILLFHNLLDFPSITQNIKDGFWADVLYYTHFDIYTLAENHFVLLVYAVIPWTGLLILGYGFGRLYRTGVDANRRRKILIWLGLSITLFFVVMRFVNVYGDPVPWSTQPRGAIYTVLSFFNLNKYPPSLLFDCMTLGPSILLLAFLEKVQNGFTRVMNIYGRVPMLYYVAHLYLLRIIGVILFFISGYTSKDIVTPNAPFLFKPGDFGYSLWGVYAIWIIVVVLLYPLCKRYNKYKSTHHQWWLSYL